MGIDLSITNIIMMGLSSLFGMAILGYGKKTSNFKAIISGIVLTFMPMFLTGLELGIGIAVSLTFLFVPLG